jgi:signal transduction histidine kinase
MLRDITERKNIERIKDEFISTMNHEIRTPLTSIQASLGLLKIKAQDSLNDTNREILNISYSNCERLSSLVNDILDLQKIASGEIKYESTVIEMSTLIREILQSHTGYAEKYKVKFIFTSVLDEIYCQIDKNRFSQALSNLLSNAAKFSPDNSMVTVSMSVKEHENVRISVADQGAGIPIEQKKRIFDKFTQIDNSSTRSKDGTGLGLHIAKSIIEALNGKLLLDTEEGKGSVFHFDLPIYNTKIQNGSRNESQ